MPARRSIAVTASTSERSSSIWRASVQRFSCRSETAGSLVDTLQEDDRDLARRLFPVVVKAWVDVSVLRVEALVLAAVRHMRPRLELFLAHLHGDLGVLEQVVVPGGVRRPAAL